ncbi:hypothetical protein BX616_003645 [Lobosporangium transversale]|nr:hypothetical protein BX616_003645 [Lobosporangium transversale]
MNVRITYYPQHNHALGETSEFHHQRISNALKTRIRYFVELGLDNRRIREKLSLPIWQLHGRLANGVVVEKLENKGEVAVGFASFGSWRNCGKSRSNWIGLHYRKGQVGKFELFTATVQERRSMRGIPAAFLLTTDKKAKLIELWLSALNKHAGPFRYITTDDSNTERLAIKNAFSDSVSIYLCLWHIARAWSQKIQTLVHGDNVEESIRANRHSKFTSKILARHNNIHLK